MSTLQLIKQLGDADFQAAVVANPHQALREVGLELPATTEVKVVRNGKDSLNIVIPTNNSEAVLSDDELSQLAAGEIIVGNALAIGLVSVVIAGIVGGAVATSLAVSHAVGAFD